MLTAILVGNGIINADGELWRIQRKAGLRFFNNANLKTFVDDVLPPILADTERTLDEAAREATMVDLQSILLELTTRLMGNMAYDVRPYLGFCARTTDSKEAVILTIDICRPTCLLRCLFRRHSTLHPGLQENAFRTRSGNSKSMSSAHDSEELSLKSRDSAITSSQRRSKKDETSEKGMQRSNLRTLTHSGIT